MWRGPELDDDREIESSLGLRSVAFPTLFIGCVLAVCLVVNPVEAGAATCFGQHATMVSSKRKIIGTSAPDVIVVVGKKNHSVNGAGGSDRICGGPGNDTINGFRGNDRIDGGGGNDRIDGVTGNDILEGGPGKDYVQGNKGNDRLGGGPGADQIVGLNGDDRLSGGAGDDELNGGAGADVMRAGSGDDVLRGEGNSDVTDGGPGRDIASYSSSSTEVQVNLKKRGRQWTKDGNDSFSGVEDLVGSAFADDLSGNGKSNRIDGGPGYDNLYGGRGGRDTAFGGPDGASCSGFSRQSNCGRQKAPGKGTSVILSRGLDGNSLVISGDRRNNKVTVKKKGSTFSVTDKGPTGVFTGKRSQSGCASTGGGSVAKCKAGRLNVILITGGDGNDVLRIGSGVPSGAQVRMNGGDDGDRLFGGPGHDVLEAGFPYQIGQDGGATSGHDELKGGGGNDAIYADNGGDLLSGQGGNDLLGSSKEVCYGHRFRGGAGKDTASWALVEPRRSNFSGRMKMSIGGRGGPASGCRRLDKVAADIESLEGSKFGDTLIGTRGEDFFLGRDGADVFLGRGGGDSIDARDGERDRKINCGGGRKTSVLTDGKDPKPRNCPGS